MHILNISLNLNKSVLISAFLHAAVFVLGLSFATVETSPLPVGVELMYGDGGTIFPAQAPEAVKPQALPKKVRPVVTDNSEGPEIAATEAKEVTAEPVETKTAGSLAGTSSRGALHGREGVANGQEVSPEERYLYEIKKLLERRKRYPQMARKMGHAGKVTMSLTLAQDGSLIESEVLAASPFETLNRAAQELVKGIHGLKPFPQEIQRTSWQITVPIEYSLN